MTMPMAPAHAPTIRVANAPCSWGALEFDVGEPLPYEQVLDEIAACGFVGTELGDWGFLPSDPLSLRSVLAERNLELVGAFVPVALARREAHAPGRDAALRVARILADSGAAPVIVLSDANGEVSERRLRTGRITAGDSLSPDAWNVFARGASDIARVVCEETGLRTAFHPHCAGYVETGWELELLLERTDPTLLGHCLDKDSRASSGSLPAYLAVILHVKMTTLWQAPTGGLRPRLPGASSSSVFAASARAPGRVRRSPGRI